MENIGLKIVSDRMESRTITIAGKRWRLMYAPLRGNDGECDAPDTTGKTIRLARYLKRYPRARAETLIHELLHAMRWEIKEETIEQMASDITRVLEQAGCLKT